MSISVEQVVKKLNDQSLKAFYNPYTKIEFPESMDPHQWFISPELISIFSTPEYSQLGENQQKALSFYETVNFFSLNIHGEKALIEGLSKRLYEYEDNNISKYIHHFLDEENKHMYYFGNFCQKYHKRIYPDRKISFPREYAPGEDDFLFFVRVFIFEEIVDYYNVAAGNDTRVCDLARAIHCNHHIDEARHLAFGRAILKDLFDRYSPEWSASVMQGIQEYIRGYYLITWREYYNPEVYKDAGLTNPFELAKRAFNGEAARLHRSHVMRSSQNYLIKCGILKEPFTV